MLNNAVSALDGSMLCSRRAFGVPWAVLQFRTTWKIIPGTGMSPWGAEGRAAQIVGKNKQILCH